MYDLIVIGGGPAGSTLSTLVAMQGHRVLLLEKDRFPRHQIGESLLPATVHGICPLLGVKETIDAAGFPKKRGGTFRWGKNPEPWTFTFTRDPDAPMGYAYQVERRKFDDILLQNARAKGVDVRESHEAEALIRNDGRALGVRYLDDRGASHQALSRYVADTGGHRGRFHTFVGERIYSRFFQNVALYAYFEGGKRLPPPNQGNILSAAFEHGWFWYIPLSDRLTSVGAVVSRQAAERMKDGHEVAFDSLVRECPMVADYLSSAKRVTKGDYGQFRIRKDYSYCNTRFWSSGLVLVGDAACFIDPVFSSGVHLATYSALLAARSINTVLRREVDEERCFREFELRYRREFGNFYQFLLAFYDMHHDSESYFWEARKVLNTKERGNEAFVRLVAGLSSSGLADEPTDAAAFFDSRRGVGTWFEGMMAEQAEGFRRVSPEEPIDRPAFAGSKFMLGFTREIVQLQNLASLGVGRPAELPLFEGGLVPTRDGLHWRAVLSPVDS